MATKVTMRYGNKNAAGNWIKVQLAQWLFHNRYTCNTDSLLQKTEEDLQNSRLWHVLPLY